MGGRVVVKGGGGSDQFKKREMKGYLMEGEKVGQYRGRSVEN